MDDFPLYARIIFQTISLIAMAILSVMIGSRIKALREAFYPRFKMIHALVFSIYAVGFIFIVSTNLVLTGWPLNRETLCRAGIYLCTACYLAAKTLVYLYLLLTVHTSREDHRGRIIPFRRDYITIAGFTVIVISIITITILAFLHPIASLNPNTGTCTIGLPPSITITILAIDAHINIILTAVFMYLTSRLLNRGSGLSFRLALHALPFRNPNPLIENLVGLPPALFMTATKEGDKRLRMAKTLWGTVGLIVPTATNLGFLLWMKGHETPWLCISCCICDGKSLILSSLPRCRCPVS
ncbi:MAG: hypothetical protein Q9188_000043 [Gyalolechia gomerana]